MAPEKITVATYSASSPEYDTHTLVVDTGIGGDIRVTAFQSEIDGVPVIQIDTDENTGHVRVHLNDGPALYDGDPEKDQPDSQHLDRILDVIVSHGDEQVSLEYIKDILAESGRATT